MAGTMASAGALLREARRGAGLSQTEVARRAGVAQSVVSAYEAGRRQPSLPMLTRLIEATGNSIDVTVWPALCGLDSLRGPLGRRVQSHRSELREAAATYGISNLRLFGSVARGDESPTSDIDFLADLSAEVGMFTLARLQREFESILDAPVEIVPAGDLKPGVRSNVDSDVVVL